MGLGQYNGLGKYCGPHTASSARSMTIIFSIRKKWHIYFQFLQNRSGGYLKFYPYEKVLATLKRGGGVFFTWWVEILGTIAGGSRKKFAL